MQDLHYAPQHEGIFNEAAKIRHPLRRSKQWSSKTLDGSSISMISDTSSSCANISPPSSFCGLRRSTCDLSDRTSFGSFSKTIFSEDNVCGTLKYRGGSATPSTREDTPGAATRALMELTESTQDSSSYQTDERNYLHSSSSFSKGEKANKVRNVDSRHLEYLMEDVFMGHVSLFCLVVTLLEQHMRSFFSGVQNHVGHFLRLLSSMWEFEEPIDTSLRSSIVPQTLETAIFQHESESAFGALADFVIHQAMLKEQEKAKDELLTPLKLVDAAPSKPTEDTIPKQRGNSVRDEWGHFADFQEELADESGFIPSCSKNPHRSSRSIYRAPSSSTNTLTPLTEVHEEEDEEEEEDNWSF